MLVQIIQTTNLRSWSGLGRCLFLVSYVLGHLILLRLPTESPDGQRDPMKKNVIIVTTFLWTAYLSVTLYVYTHTFCGVHLLLVVSPT